MAVDGSLDKLQQVLLLGFIIITLALMLALIHCCTMTDCLTATVSTSTAALLACQETQRCSCEAYHSRITLEQKHQPEPAMVYLAKHRFQSCCMRQALPSSLGQVL